MKNYSTMMGVIVSAMLALGAICLGLHQLSVATKNNKSPLSLWPEQFHTDSLLKEASIIEHTDKTLALVGTLQKDKTILLKNKMMDGKVGYYVFTPLLLRRGQGKIIIVLLGWVPEKVGENVSDFIVKTPKHERMSAHSPS